MVCVYILKKTAQLYYSVTKNDYLSILSMLNLIVQPSQSHPDEGLIPLWYAQYILTTFSLLSCHI